VAPALDSRGGEGARDVAPPVARAAVAEPDPPPAPDELPPLALVIARELPADVRDLPPSEQATRLRDQVIQGAPAARWVELGSLLQQLGRGPMAGGAFQNALALEPGNLEAQVGLALVDGATGPEGATRAAATLSDLAGANPGSQVVAFNQGWLAVYRGQAGAARSAWERTIALGATTRLGLSAAALLDALGSAGGGRNP
jgi:cytochrome c-type biogenesis protein CcmH/NrfG